MKKILMIIFALLGLCAIGASVTSTEIGNLHDYHNVITNVDLTGLATSEELASVNTTATNALDKAEAAKTTADEAMLNSGTANNKADYALRVANGAQVTANAANTKADSIRTDLGTVGTVATNALNKANAAQDTANTANTNANSAKTTATEAKTSAKTANDNVTKVLQILEGDDFRITVTNYDSKVNAPMASFDAKYTDGTNVVWTTVWNETNQIEIAKKDIIENVKSNYFDKGVVSTLVQNSRAWGNYDSTTGQQLEEGMAQCSNEGGMIFGNGAGYKSVATTSGNAYWIWQMNSGLARVQEDGTFTILDGDGNQVFSVTKGNKQILGADASAINVTDVANGKQVQITYSVESASHPTIEYSSTLQNGGTWYKEGNSDFPNNITVSWNSESPWVCTITDTDATPSGFFRATYESGADTVVTVGDTPLGMNYIYLGGKKYKVAPITISGQTVMGLTEVN